MLSPVAEPSFVTGISPDGRAPGNLVIEINGARFASLPAEVVGAVGIGAGVRLQSESWTALTEAADTEAAYQVGLRALRARPRSMFEMRRRLGERGYRGAVADGAVARLRDQGYLDDAAFARNFVEVRIGRGHGRARVLADLSRRGVDRHIAELAVQETMATVGFDEGAEIERVVEKRLSQLRHLAPEVARRRLFGYLQRRGYSGGDVFSVVDRLLEEHRTP